ncbi:MAG: ATP-binding protein [Bacteroidales bacterium]
MLKKWFHKLKILISKFSIKTKIILIIISVSLIALFIGFSIITFVNISNLKSNLVSQGLFVARLMSSYSSYGLMFNDKRSLDDDLKNLEKIDFIIAAEIYDNNGKVFTTYKNKISTKPGLIVRRSIYEFKNNELLIYEPILSNESEYLGTVFLRITMEALDRSVNDFLGWIVLIVLGVMAFTLLIANSFQKIISGPILKLAGLTGKISESNDFSIRITGYSNDEIGTLYKGFNNMLEEIARRQTEMKVMQDKLKDSEEQFSTFMKMLPAAAFIKDKNSAFLYVNKFMHDNFEAGLWIGKDLKENNQWTGKYFSSLFDTEALNNLQHFEELLYDKFNTPRYYDTWKFPIQRKEKETLIGGISFDTTNRKMVEKQVDFYIKELERNNKELEEFNYVASHDLKEPLRTITSYCELLKEDLGSSLSELAKEDIKFITDATLRMNILIQDLLMLSRAGRVEYENREVDLSKVISTVLKDLELKINETKAIIIVGKLPMVMGDPVQLGRVFQNLITNAIKFRSDKDPEITISSQDFGQYFEITVKDNGIGIEEQYFNQIFAAFKRLHSRQKYEGTGIGLAICKKIIERHGGLIRIESEPGSGSSFIIHLLKKTN